MSTTRSGISPQAVNTRHRVESEPDEILTAVTAMTGICASVTGILLVLTVSGHWPALVGALLVVCVPPGAAVMCWVDTDWGIVQAGLTLVLSLAVTAIVTAAMIWLGTWHPKVLLALAFLSALSCAARLWRWGIPPMIWTARTREKRLWVRLAPLIVGLAAWAYGVSQIQPESIGPYGLLANANPWFLLGVAILLGGGLVELLRGTPRASLLCTYLLALIVTIDATVPILFKAPEYSWVYKHVGIIQLLGHYGRVIDPSDIYQQWPALFSTVASVSGLAKVGPLEFTAWAPLAFELADALLLLGIFRMLAATRRAAYVALFLYEGFIAWVGQDYLSPQAFGYLLWLGIAAIIVRWLLVPGRGEHNSIVSRLRARLLAQMSSPPRDGTAQRWFAIILVIVIYFAITAAHQLTPYMVLAGVGALVLLGLLWRGWLLLAFLIVAAGGYLAPRYGMISSQFGGLFSGGNALENASGVQTIARHSAELFTAECVHYLAVAMWLLALAAIIWRWRALGRVVVPAVLAFTPFIIILVQNYGGEAIYRVFMFSSPWCAFLIADFFIELRATVWRRLLVICVCVGALGAGLQGLYGSVAIDAFTAQELSASLWLYSHAPQGSLLVLADQDFPIDEVANSNAFERETIPADPQLGSAWLDEANVPRVEKWLASFGQNVAYVVFSHSMDEYASFWGAPSGYFQMKSIVGHMPGWSVVYRNTDTTIYRVRVITHAS